MNDGNNGGLYFIVGALAIVVAAGAYVLWGHGGGTGASRSAGSASSTIERTTVAPNADQGVTVTRERETTK